MAAVERETVSTIPWWKEPTKDQWLAWSAAWLGWTLDAFDFTIFLLIMLPISQEFNVPLTAVTAVFTLTLWMRLVGATASGWLADRIGRKKPLMISIAWYSACNFIAGFSPAFWFLFLFRALLGIGMGAEWPCGAALAMESWPIRSRGYMAGVLQASWGIGALLSSAAYGLLYTSIGWRGLLMIGVLPALSIVYVRRFVKEPPVWVENRRLQRVQQREEAGLVRQDKEAHETLRFVVKSFDPIGGRMGHGHQRGERNKILRSDRRRVRFGNVTASALVTGVRPLGNILRKSLIQPTRNAVWVKSMKNEMNDFVSEAVVGEFVGWITHDEEASG